MDNSQNCHSPRTLENRPVRSAPLMNCSRYGLDESNILATSAGVTLGGAWSTRGTFGNASETSLRSSSNSSQVSALIRTLVDGSAPDLVRRRITASASIQPEFRREPGEPFADRSPRRDVVVPGPSPDGCDGRRQA